eukprot:scaffold40731_cov67-Phaeocystis_antarctica.AAC.2
MAEAHVYRPTDPLVISLHLHRVGQIVCVSVSFSLALVAGTIALVRGLDSSTTALARCLRRAPGHLFAIEWRMPRRRSAIDRLDRDLRAVVEKV